MKLLRRRSPSWTSLFISCFFVAVVIQPIQAKEVTEIPNVQELDRSARTVKEWLAQIEQQNPPAQSQEAEVVQVTSVKANPTSKGMEVILQTSKGQQLQVVNRSNGNSNVYLDQYSGEVLRVDNGLKIRLGDRVLNSFTPLHYGTFGGLPTRILYVFVGLAPLILFVTGFVMWWYRKRKHKQDHLINRVI